MKSLSSSSIIIILLMLLSEMFAWGEWIRDCVIRDMTMTSQHQFYVSISSEKSVKTRIRIFSENSFELLL